MKSKSPKLPVFVIDHTSQLWQDLMKIEEEHPNFMVGNRLSWPKPLPRKKKPVAVATKSRASKTAAAAKA